MKSTVILWALAIPVLAAQPVLVRVTPETLKKLQEKDPMIRLEQPSPDDAKVKRPVDASILLHSTVLHDGKNWTLVPHGALVHLPDSLKARVNSKPVGTLLPWHEFLRRNPTWLVSHEVTFEQAAGNESLPADAAKAWKSMEKIVVAVRQTGPISVRVADGQSLTQR
jgi:hypothetical protein